MFRAVRWPSNDAVDSGSMCICCLLGHCLADKRRRHFSTHQSRACSASTRNKVTINGRLAIVDDTHTHSHTQQTRNRRRIALSPEHEWHGIACACRRHSRLMGRNQSRHSMRIYGDVCCLVCIAHAQGQSVIRGVVYACHRITRTRARAPITRTSAADV